MYNIAIIRPFGNNVGNWAINFAIRQMLHEKFGRLVSIIDVPATKKYESSGAAGLTAQTVHYLNRIADGVIVGGGNLFENGEIDISADALAALEPPLFVFSNSWGRIYNNKCRLVPRSDSISPKLLGALCDTASLVFSRDSATSSHLRALGLPDNIGFCPTLNIGRYRALLPELPVQEYVGALISIRAPRLMNVPAKIQAGIFDQILAITGMLKRLGYPRVRLLCNDSRDVEFASVFRGSHGIDTIYASDIYQYLRLLADSEIVVSYRLHATLPAVSLGTKVFSLAYDERALSLFDDVGLEYGRDYINVVTEYEDALGRLEQRLTDISEDPTPPDFRRWDEIHVAQMSMIESFKKLIDDYRAG